MASLQTAPIGGNTTDLSIQTFNGVFGTNWFSMDPSISGSASIIVEMLTLLNELAIFAITLLFSVTYITAVVGTAHEGTPLGKRLHSFWVPVRFSLSVGMLVPLKSGLCLFQLILLTTVGWSVHFANELWDVFLDSSVKSSIVAIVKDSDVPTPIRVESEKVAADVLSNLVVYKYLESQYHLEGQNLAYKLSDDKKNTLHYTWKFRDPATLVDDHGAFGSVEVFCRKLSTCDK